MKKFKVIEKSRFLASKEQMTIIGGAVSLCDVSNFHRSCDMIPINYVTCGAGVADGYNWGPSGESCGGSGIKFKTSNCAGLGWFSTICSGVDWHMS